MNKIGENGKIYFIYEAKTARFAFFLLHTYLTATILTLTSLRSELLHGTNLEICDPKRYLTNFNVASTNLYTYEPRGSST